MADLCLDIGDAALRVVLKTLLEREGHRVVGADGALVITDDYARAPGYARRQPCLVLARAGQIGEAAGLMRHANVYGYIFVPLQPDEAVVMVARAFVEARALMEARASGEPPDAISTTPPVSLRQLTDQVVLETVRRHRGNKAAAARALGVGRNTLWRRLRRMRQQERD